MTCAPYVQPSGVAVREMTEAPCAGPESPRVESSWWELDQLSGERATPSRGLPARSGAVFMAVPARVVLRCDGSSPRLLLLIRCTDFAFVTRRTRPGTTDAGGPMKDDSVAADEARRVAQHEEVKSHVEHDVNADIEKRSDRPDPAEAPRIDT